MDRRGVFSRLKLPLVFGAILVFFVLGISSSLSETSSDSDVSLDSKGVNWERNCAESGGCETVLYSYQKYYVNENDEWEQIDERFRTENCEEGYDVCVDRNLYQVHVKSDSDSTETIKYVKDGVALTFQPLGISYRTIDSSQGENAIGRSAEVNENRISYHNIFGRGIDLDYTYFPSFLKQELILEDRSVLPEIDGEFVGNDISFDLDYNLIVDADTDILIEGEVWDRETDFEGRRTGDPVFFRNNGDIEFFMPEPVAYDSNGSIIKIDYEFVNEDNETRVRIKTPYEWLENAVYPVVIDPTVEITDISDDGGVRKDTLSFPHNYFFYKPKTGYATLGADSLYVNRWAMEWNLSSILNDANISDVTLQLFVDSAGQNDYLNISHMEGGFDDYPNTSGECEGNCNFYNDMGNGTQYASHTFSNNVTDEFLNLSFNSAGANDIESALSNDIFNIGLHSHYSDTLSIGRRTNSDELKRPKLIIDASKIVPQIKFVDPTPSNGTTQTIDSIFVNISSIDEGDHATLLDFERDLLLWLNMDEVNLSEDPIDLSTYGNNAAAVGGAELTSDGYYGQGYIFDGDDGYLNLGTISEGYPLQLTGEFTISTWFYSDISGDRYGRVIDKSDGSQAENGWAVYRDNSLRTIRMDVNGSGRIISSVTYTYQEWTHAVFVNNGSTWRLYVDGVEDTGATVNNYQQAPDVETTARIGTWNHATGREWSGKLDEVAIFNRALSDSEVLSLYNASANQYENNFTNLEDGDYNFTAYAIDFDGNWQNTEKRVVTLDIPEEYDLVYDENGNLIEGFGKTLTYNSFNKLIQVNISETGEVIADYVYDNGGERIKKTEYNIDASGNNKTTYYIDESFIQTRYTNGTIVNETYYYANGKMLVKKNNEGDKFYYHPDHLGSTTLVTNQSGDVAEEIFYLPYGGLLTENSDERFQYTGQEKDKETGFQYYGARYYDSDFRRFLQPDPIIADIYDPQNLNRYSYVLNNPYKYVDPSGNFVDTVADVAFIGYDIYAIIKNPEDSSNYLALAADVVGAVVPGLTGFGVAVKAAKNADKIGDAAKAITKTDDTIDAVRGAEKGVDGVTSAGGKSSLGSGVEEQLEFSKNKFYNIRNSQADQVTFRGAKEERAGKFSRFDHITKIKQAGKGIDNEIKRIENFLKKRDRFGLNQNQIKRLEEYLGSLRSFGDSIKFPRGLEDIINGA